MPPPLTGLIAVGVCGFELLAGGVALFCLQHSAAVAMQIWVLVSAAVAGTAFWLYIRQLLRKPAGVTSCGCSPLAAPVTRASLAPSIGLVCISILGLGAIAGAWYGEPRLLIVLPCLWGATFGWITLLYPASVLQL